MKERASEAGLFRPEWVGAGELLRFSFGELLVRRGSWIGSFNWSEGGIN